jgi:hypothetical protein
MTPHSDADWLSSAIAEMDADPELKQSERLMLKAGLRILQPMLGWEREGEYFYSNKLGQKELRIPYSEITLRELRNFSEAVCDADMELVIVRVG